MYSQCYVELSFTEINHYLAEKIVVEQRLKLLESVLENYQLQNLEMATESTHLESVMKKAKKYKEIKEENKKLRRALKVEKNKGVFAKVKEKFG